MTPAQTGEVLGLIGTILSVLAFVRVCISAWLGLIARVKTLEDNMPTELKQRLVQMERDIPDDGKQRIAVLEEKSNGLANAVATIEARMYAAIQRMEDTASDLEVAVAKLDGKTAHI